MRHHLLTILLFTAFSDIYTQNDSLNQLLLKNNSYEIIKTRPGGILMGPNFITSEWGLNYEFTVAEKTALSIGASILSKNIFIYMAERIEAATQRTGSNMVQIFQVYKISGYRFQAQYKWIMPIYRFPCGMYFGPHASYSHSYFSYRQRGYTKDYYRVIHKNISFLLGYQHLLNDKLFIDLYCGLGYKNNSMYYHKTTKDFKKEENDYLLTGFPMKLKFSLGYYLGYKF